MSSALQGGLLTTGSPGKSLNYFSIIKGATTLYSFVSASPSLTTEVSACVQMLKYYQSPVHRFLYFLQDITGTIRIIFDENKI